MRVGSAAGTGCGPSGRITPPASSWSSTPSSWRRSRWWRTTPTSRSLSSSTSSVRCQGQKIQLDLWGRDFARTDCQTELSCNLYKLTQLTPPGHLLSLLTLSLSLFIFAYFRSDFLTIVWKDRVYLFPFCYRELRCIRHKVHIGLFIAFGLADLAWLSQLLCQVRVMDKTSIVVSIHLHNTHSVWLHYVRKNDLFPILMLSWCLLFWRWNEEEGTPSFTFFH